MAIVIEEEKNKIGIFTIVAWLVVLILIGSAVYYIFFKKPQYIELSPPSDFSNTAALSKVKLSPEEIVNSPNFQVLKQYITPPSTGNAGRQNPFLGFEILAPAPKR